MALPQLLLAVVLAGLCQPGHGRNVHTAERVSAREGMEAAGTLSAFSVADGSLQEPRPAEGTPTHANVSTEKEARQLHARKLQEGCANVRCPDFSECQPVGGAPTCVCPEPAFSRLLNGICTIAPLLHWGYVDAHNNARAGVGAVPLVWDNNLAKAAQRWANNLAFGVNQCGLRLGGAPRNSGQNVANFFRDAGVLNFQAMNLWVKQGGNYALTRFNNQGAAGCNTGNWQDCAAYTQVIWNNTRRIGCGVGKCPAIEGKVWVCYYWPRGNVVGQFPISPN